MLHKFVYTQADKRAAPEGGIEALFRLMTKNLRYPKDEADYAGRVIVAFVIEPNGKIDGKRTIRDPSGTKRIFSKQVLKIINKLKWNPALCNGKAVPFLVTLPVSIDLTE